MSVQRRGRRADAAHAPINQLPWKQPECRFPYLEVLSADELEAIHNASLRVLEEIGLEIMSDRALGILKAAGAKVDMGRQHAWISPQRVLGGLCLGRCRKPTLEMGAT